MRGGLGWEIQGRSILPSRLRRKGGLGWRRQASAQRCCVRTEATHLRDILGKCAGDVAKMSGSIGEVWRRYTGDVCRTSPNRASLYLPYISPTSPLYLPCISHAPRRPERACGERGCRIAQPHERGVRHLEDALAHALLRWG